MLNSSICSLEGLISFGKKGAPLGAPFLSHRSGQTRDDKRIIVFNSLAI